LQLKNWEKRGENIRAQGKRVCRECSVKGGGGRPSEQEGGRLEGKRLHWEIRQKRHNKATH